MFFLCFFSVFPVHGTEQVAADTREDRGTCKENPLNEDVADEGENGIKYHGCHYRALNGDSCIRWDSELARYKLARWGSVWALVNPDKEETKNVLKDYGAYCRNPGGSSKRGIWCYALDVDGTSAVRRSCDYSKDEDALGYYYTTCMDEYSGVCEKYKEDKEAYEEAEGEGGGGGNNGTNVCTIEKVRLMCPNLCDSCGEHSLLKLNRAIKEHNASIMNDLLTEVIRNNDSDVVLPLLTEEVLNKVTSRSIHGSTPLINALMTQNATIVNILLDTGKMDMTKPDARSHKTPLDHLIEQWSRKCQSIRKRIADDDDDDDDTGSASRVTRSDFRIPDPVDATKQEARELLLRIVDSMGDTGTAINWNHLGDNNGSRKGRPLIKIAAQEGSSDMIEVLRKASNGTLDVNQGAPIFDVFKNKDLDTLRTLLDDKNIKIIEPRNEDGMNVWEVAQRSGAIEMEQMLEKHLKNRDKPTPVHRVSIQMVPKSYGQQDHSQAQTTIKPKNPRLKPLAETSKAQNDEVIPGEKRPPMPLKRTTKASEGFLNLVSAIRKGNATLVENFASHCTRTELNAYEKGKGQTPLILAIRKGNHRIVEALLSSRGKDIDVNKREKTTGKAPIHYAVNSQDIDIVCILLQYQNLDIDAKSKKGKTALDVATKKGNLPNIEYALKAAANKNPLPCEPSSKSGKSNRRTIKP